MDSNTDTTTTTLLCWGCGEFGQHCQGHINDVSFRESEVTHFGSSTALGTVSLVACGASHTVAVSENGEVYSWGNGNSGQLGTGDPQTRWSPTRVAITPPLPKGSKIRTLACGSRHTLLVLDNGHVHSFGNNFYAQLGYNFREKNYKENQMRPQWLEFLKHRPVRQVACGEKHSLFLFTDGSMAAVGNNAHGQLGDGGREESRVPKAVDIEDTVTSVVCGPYHNMVLTDSSDVYVWGYGKPCGKRRHDVTTPEMISFKGMKVIQVAGGSTHSLALTAGGRVYSWGFGMDGQLGLGPVVIMATRPRRLRHSFLEEGASFVACGDVFSAVITASGLVYMWGRNSHAIHEGKGSLHKVWEPHCLNPTEPQPLRPVRRLACGAWHVAAITGLPDAIPEPEADDVSSDDDDTDSRNSISSGLSSASSGQSVGRRFRQTDGLPPQSPQGDARVDVGGGMMEVSVPPHTTTTPGTPRSSSPARPAPFLVTRGQTRLTLAEFYASSSDSASSPQPPADFHTHNATSSPSPGHPPKTTPLVIEVPSMPVDPESDLDEPLPVSTKEEMRMIMTSLEEKDEQAGQHPSPGNPLPPLLLPEEPAENEDGGERGGGENGRKCSGWSSHHHHQSHNNNNNNNNSNSNNSSRSVDSTGKWPPGGVKDELVDNMEKGYIQDRTRPARKAVVTDRGGGGGGGGRQKGTTATSPEKTETGLSLAIPKSRAIIITTNNTNTNGQTVSSRSSTAAHRPSQPLRERSVVVSGKNVDILDAGQLLTGSPVASTAAAFGKTGIPHPSPTTANGTADFYYIPGPRPHGGGGGREGGGGIGGGGGGLGYFQDLFASGAVFPFSSSSGLEHLGDFDFDYLEASPRAFSKDLPLQDVPTVQLEGDFWPRHVQRSATFFGALSVHVTRSPAKFFRKPTPSPAPHLNQHPHLSRTTTPSHPRHTPLTRTRTQLAVRETTTVGGGGGGRRGGGRGGPGGIGRGAGTGGGGRNRSSRPNTRGPGSLMGGSGGSPGRAESLRVPSSSLGRRGAQDHSHAHAHAQNHAYDHTQERDPHGGSGRSTTTKLSSKTPFFSSANSWRRRPQDLPEHLFHDDNLSQSQSAPSSSNAGRGGTGGAAGGVGGGREGGGNKYVAFASDWADSRNLPNGGPAGPASSKPQAPGTRAVSARGGDPAVTTPPAASSSPAGASSRLLAENAGVPLLLREGVGTGGSSGGFHGVALGEGVGARGPPRGENLTRPAGAVADSSGYQLRSKGGGLSSKLTCHSSTKPRDATDAARPEKQQPLTPMSGQGHHSLLGNKKSTAVTYLAGSNRSRTKILVSGAGERNRKQFN